jgi:hypothetical protein
MNGTKCFRLFRSFWLAPAFRIARTEAAPKVVQGRNGGSFQELRRSACLLAAGGRKGIASFQL